MPLVLEDDARLANGFDPATAATLYWKDVPVLVRQQDREDQTEALTFRILSGVTRQNHSLRVLRIHASSEGDPYFLHTLEVTEDEFQCLKAEQGILVDFGSFPGKLISLLERVISSHEADMPRFQAVLAVRPGASLLQVVETNDFKQLPHISLAFRPGNDYAVKQFLAFRLGEVKDDCHKLRGELSSSQGECASTQQQLHDCQAQLADLAERHQRQTLELQAQLREQAAAAQQDKLQQLADLRSQLEGELEAAAKRASGQQALLTARIAELDSEGRQLRDAKYSLDSTVSELSHRLASAQGSVKSLEREVEALRSSSAALAGDKQAAEVALAEAKAQLAALTEKCATQSQLVAQQAARLGDLEGVARQWEGRCADLRAAAAAHEARAKEAAGEVLKGNDALERLHSEVRLLKEKVKRKQAILVRQEEELAARDNQMAAAARELASLGSSSDGLAGQLAASQAEVAELRAKLEDSRQQLQSNEQMIRWLNQQVTDAQLQVGAVPGSRFKFRPSQLAGTSFSAGGGGGSAALSTPPAVGSGGGYGGAAARAALSSPAATHGGLQHGSSKLAGTGVAGKHSAVSSLSFAASPTTVTPRQEFVLPAQPATGMTAGTVRH